MSHRQRRYSKRELLGNLHVDYVMSVTDLGLAAEIQSLGCIARIPGRWGSPSGTAGRGGGWVSDPPEYSGTSQTQAGSTLYAEPLQAFFWLRFDFKEDTLNGDDFQLALRVSSPAEPDQ